MLTFKHEYENAADSAAVKVSSEIVHGERN